MIELLEPMWLIGIIPVAVLLFAIMRKDFTKTTGDAKRMAKVRKWVLLSRIIIIILIFVALATPTILSKDERQTPPRIEMLVDQSASMGVFDMSFVDSLENALSKEIPVNVKIIATGDSSDIGDQVLANMEEDKSLLLITDGQLTSGVDLGDVSMFARNTNVTINAIDLQSAEPDVGISVLGPTKTVVDAENSFLVDVSAVGTDDYKLEVDIDGSPVVLSQNNVFKYTAGVEGYFNIRARIIPSSPDKFEGNNVFYKTVRVVERPKILYYSEKQDPLLEILKKLYSVKETNLIPDDLEDYHAIVVNDISSDKINNIEKLKDYIINGNGMMVVGGFDSFDRDGYRNSVFESLLPVRVGTGNKKSGDASIVIVIDVSGSTGGATTIGGKVVDVEKSLAVSVIDDLSIDNRVGVVAFNTDAYLVQPLSPLYSTREESVDKISRLTNGGGTTISSGLLGAHDLLKGISGSNIILISDGMSNGGLDIEKSKNLVETFNQEGIKTYTVGVGAATNEEFLIQLAQLGGASYFKADETNKLKVLFGEAGDFKPGSVFGFVTIDTNHFITQNLNIYPVLDAYNFVSPKDSAQMLISTDFGNPAVTVWRYGVGRIATLTAFSTSNNLGTLLNADNSVLITRIGNWVIGDPERKLSYSIKIDDIRLNEKVRVVIKSDTYPASDKVNFVKIDEDTYAGSFKPEAAGFFDVLGAEYSVSYEKEYEKLGVNEKLKFFVEETGGEMFKPNEVENIIQHVKTTSKRVRVVETSLQWIFLAAALIIFLVEVSIRRLKVLSWASI
jgi:Mg-chelatase subunit ChlD